MLIIQCFKGISHFVLIYLYANSSTADYQMKREVTQYIGETMRALEKQGGFYISDVSNRIEYTEEEIRSIQEGGKKPNHVLQIVPYGGGRGNALLCFNFNQELLAGKTVGEIDDILKKSDLSVANSLYEALIHESAHAECMQGKTLSDIDSMAKELKGQGRDVGLSIISKSDGAEALAEMKVLISRGETLSENDIEFYNKYMKIKMR